MSIYSFKNHFKRQIVILEKQKNNNCLESIKIINNQVKPLRLI